MANMIEWDYAEGMQVSRDLQTKSELLEKQTISEPTGVVLTGVSRAKSYCSYLQNYLEQYKQGLYTEGGRVMSRTNFLYTTDTELGDILSC